MRFSFAALDSALRRYYERRATESQSQLTLVALAWRWRLNFKLAIGRPAERTIVRLLTKYQFIENLISVFVGIDQTNLFTGFGKFESGM